MRRNWVPTKIIVIAVLLFNSWAEASIYSVCVYHLTGKNIEADGLTETELRKAYDLLSIDKHSGRNVALLAGKDPSNVLVDTEAGRVPLKQVLGENRGLLLLIKEMPKALPFWRVLARFPSWRLYSSDQGVHWTASVKNESHTTKLEVSNFKGINSITLTFWTNSADSEVTKNFNRRVDRVFYEVTALADGEMNQYIVKPSYRYGGNIGYLRGFNSVTMTFREQMLN